MSINYSEKIPNNVNLSEDRTLQRALEQWQPNYLEWWSDVGPDGSVWVATSDGVRHFKRGGGFEDFKTTNSPLANNEVRAVCVDKVTGVVWFGTAAGINRYDPNYVAPTPPALGPTSRCSPCCCNAACCRRAF